MTRTAAVHFIYFGLYRSPFGAVILLPLAVIGLAATAMPASGQQLSCSATRITPPLSFQNRSRSHKPAISGNGRFVAFISDSNDTWNGPGFLDSIYLYDTDTGQLQRLLAEIDVYELAISGDGGRIAFVTSRNLTGGNSDFSSELYLYLLLPAGSSVPLTPWSLRLLRT